MKRLLKWTVRVLRGVALLALILLVLGVTVLPGWIEGKAVSALHEAGFDEAALEVRYAGMSGAGISAVKLGAGHRFRVDQVEVDYGISDLLDGRVKAVSVSGVHWRVSYQNGVWDWAPFSELRSEKEGSGELPFERVTIRSGQLQFDWEEKSLDCSVDGEIEGLPDGRLALDLKLGVAGTALRLRGTMDLNSAALDLSLAGEVTDLAALVSTLPSTVASLPGSPGGQLRFEVELATVDEEYRIFASGAGESLTWFGQVGERILGARLGTLKVERVVGEFSAGRFTVREAQGELSFADVRFGGLPPWELSFSGGHTQERGTVVHARLHDPVREPPSLDLSVTASGNLATSPPRPVEATLDGRLDLPLLQVLDPALVPKGVVVDDDAKVWSGLSLTFVPPLKSGDAWGVEGEAQFSVTASQMRLPELGARLQGVRLQSAIALSFAGTDGSLTLQPGARFVADSARLREMDGRPRVTAEGPEALSIEVVEAGRLQIRRDGDVRRITGSLDRLSLAANGLVVKAGKAEARDLNLTILAGLALSDEALTARSFVGSTVHLDGAILVPRELELTAKEGRPLAEILFDDVRFEWERAHPGIWRVEAPATRVRAGGTARLLRQGTIVEGADVEVSVAGTGSQDGVELTLGEGGALSWESIRSERGDFAAALLAGHLNLSGREGAARFRLGFDDAGADLRGSVVARCPAGLTIDDPALGSVALSELTLDAELQVGAGMWKTEVALDVAATPRLNAGVTGNVEVAWDNVLGLKAKVIGQSISTEVSEARWELELDANTRKQEQSLLAKWSDGEVLVGAASLRAHAEIEGDRPAALRGELKVSGAELFYRPASLTVSDVTLAVPFAFGAELAGKGTLSAGSIWLGDDVLPEVSGEVGLAEGRLELAVDWKLLEGAVAKVQGSFHPFERIPRGELTVDLPTVTFDGDTQPGELLGTLRDYVFGGEMSLAARVTIDGPRIKPDVKLNLSGLSLSSEVLELAASGIDADITVDGLTPLSTPGAQRLRIAKGVLGKLRVDNGELQFRLESAHSLFLEQASFGWVGGRLYTYAVRFDPAQSKLDLVVYADNLQLDQLLQLLAEDEATGTGALYGRLPVQLDGTKISYGDAFLYAEPGLGALSVLDPGGFLDQLPEVARGALKDFQYSVMKLKYDPTGVKDAILRVRGVSRDPSFPRELILDVNIAGFKDLLDGAIIVRRMSKGVQGR